MVIVCRVVHWQLGTADLCDGLIRSPQIKQDLELEAHSRSCSLMQHGTPVPRCVQEYSVQTA